MRRADLFGLGALGLVVAASVRGVLLGRQGGTPAAAARARATSPAPLPAPKRYAYIYQGPNEIAVRMAIGTSPATAKEMGLFGSAKTAAAVARQQGAELAWEGVREL